MLESVERNGISIWKRSGVWFVCLFLSVALFSLFLALFLWSAGSAKMWIIFPIFRVTTKFALPVWFVYLLVVIAVKNAEGRKIWTLLLSGSLIGPLVVFLWSLTLQLRGFSQKAIWLGDPLLGWLGGGIASMIFSLIVGFLTTSFYLVVLKILHRRSIASESRFV